MNTGLWNMASGLSASPSPGMTVNTHLQPRSPLMRHLPPGLAVLAMLALAPIAHGAEIVAPSNVPIKQTVVTLAANTDTTLGSSTSRRYLCLMNIGTGLMSLGFDQAAVAGSGWALEGVSVAGHQGGSMCWETAIVAGSVVHGISAAGTTVIVLEGR
jgi:hypothetical protein